MRNRLRRYSFCLICFAVSSWTAFFAFYSLNEAKKRELSGTKDQGRGISKENARLVDCGMPYEEVCRLFGCKEGFYDPDQKVDRETYVRWHGFKKMGGEGNVRNWYQYPNIWVMVEFDKNSRVTDCEISYPLVFEKSQFLRPELAKKTETLTGLNSETICQSIGNVHYPSIYKGGANSKK
jgi:hypothetical protein